MDNDVFLKVFKVKIEMNNTFSYKFDFNLR